MSEPRGGGVVGAGRVVRARTRRSFLGALGRTTLVAAAGTGSTGLLACGDARRSREESREGGERTEGAGASPLSRPVLRPWADGMVWLAAATEEPPVAYVSMARREVYVDHEYRDRAAWLLDAHISVSTALWRIRLPGDPESEPITPGDAAREFEELTLEDWDRTQPPAMDDIRIVRGKATSRTVHFACVPLGRESSRVSAGPFELTVAVGDGTVREDFMIVGRGMRHRDQGCSGAGEAVQLVGWAVRG